MLRVRFAPSPTGFLHIGGLRTALYDWMLARRHGGVFVLRIEDTDQARFVHGAIENIIRTLAWAGMSPDEGPYFGDDGTVQERGDYGPYRQSRRLELYRGHADALVAKGDAYPCFCAASRLETMRTAQQAAGMPVMYDRTCRDIAPTEAARRVAAGDAHVIRMKVPVQGTTSFDDAIRGHVSFSNDDIDDQVLLKSDGFPTYHLAAVVDDHAMRISHVIRGEEWLPSTPKHMLLYRAFGWEPPAFAHLPLLLNADRSKLSKRQGDVAVEDYAAKGYLPEALVNFIALLGWNPSGSQEVYTKEELAESFDLARVNRAGAVFNVEKLDWLNREYLKALPLERVAAAAREFYAKQGIVIAETQETTYLRAVHLERSRLATLAEFPDATSYFFDADYPLAAADLPGKGSDAATAASRLADVSTALELYPEDAFDQPNGLEAGLLALIKERGWTNAETLWPMRVALSGRRASPGPFELAWAFGKAKTLFRLARARSLL